MVISDSRLRRWAVPMGVLTGMLLAGCAGTDDSSTTAADTDEHPEESSNLVEAPTPRLVATYDGGVLVLDAETLDVVDDIALDGFNRLNPAGDGRHVLISTAAAFRALDTGVWTEQDGEQRHYAEEPALTDIEFDTERPGHVVSHAGKTVLFSDGTGQIEIFETYALDGTKPDTEIVMAEDPHHGVAVELENGGLLVTLGTEESRTGVKVLDAERDEITRNEDCPGVHGEAMAADEAIVIGCQDGVLVYHDGTITKIDSPDEYGRIGNQAGSEESSVVLGDYKVDPDADLERPERISLIDTTTNTLELVDLDASYTFRSLARGPAGEALILGTDGAIHVVDPDSAEVVSTIPVIGEWEEPMDWQQPRPTIFVQGDIAYVTDPSTDELHAVDLSAGTIVNSAELPATPNELTGVSG
ncbi:zinc metallochaperone AztD [Phytoactinopolyspora mesophila]|uniref:PQQ-binding-like beta-propeller repeat protein n=1 Tax=Phytoactinopolyspora mesophila TaxID=2650750 RepID=A0A7K3MBX8_9ACTN|nr:zinc metallochaperone AztD [Phytoactinopolyspora mesophila]NDL60814.1 hypothetical protein [Phytoactinopolyspora mesophila]